MEQKMFFKRDKQTEFLLITKHCLVQLKVRLHVSLFSSSTEYIKERIGMVYVASQCLGINKIIRVKK